MTLPGADQTQASIRRYFLKLMEFWGPQDWWPARTRFEVIVGAYLTQNTAWSNVERALRNLRQRGILNVAGIRRTSLPLLEQLVRPSGYFHQKAQRLKNFVRFIDQHHGSSLGRMFARSTPELREELLALNGVGPETADSILLYAGAHPVFVVDAYTRRVFGRHGLLTGRESYEEIRQLFESTFADVQGLDWLKANVQAQPRRKARRRHKFRLTSASERAKIFDEYHALLVQVAKYHCLKKIPLCEGCPLQPLLPAGGPQATMRPAGGAKIRKTSAR